MLTYASVLRVLVKQAGHVSVVRHRTTTCIKGRVQCFSMQVVMSKCFLLNSEKTFGSVRLVVFEKNSKKHSLIPKNDVTELKARLL